MEDPKKRLTAGIAIVEDEKELVDVYVKLFTRRGIPVCFVAYDGLEAIKKFMECLPKPHIILMDYRLPGMSGLDATREMLKIDPDAKVIFISADFSVRASALEAGAFTFIKKPASLRVITDTIEQLIDAYPQDQF